MKPQVRGHNGWLVVVGSFRLFLDLALPQCCPSAPDSRSAYSTRCYTSDMTSRGDVLREVMLETGTTQSDLSRLSGVRQPSISGFLSGRVDLSDDQLDRLLSCMGFRLEVVRRPITSQRQDLRVGVTREAARFFGTLARGECPAARVASVQVGARRLF